ncbi:MAG: CaiB/BaiF CoA transferase family protein [Bacilli bacterium]
MGKSPLSGVRVLELGTLVAAPSAGRIFADFGADVIKIEAPDGDPLRKWGKLAPSGSSWWWHMQARNKRLVAVDLKTSEGQKIVQDLARQSDILIENLRPGRLTAWNLGYEQVAAVNPSIVYVSISGYGQSGPYRERAGFGNIAESMGGLRFVTGFPDMPPVRTGISLGDEVAAFQAVIGALMALHRRTVDPDRKGDHVDVALTESVLSLTEGMLSEYLHEGVVQERTGNQLLRAAPSNIYPTADHKWIAIGANSSGTFTKLLTIMNRMDLLNDSRFQSNPGRVAHADELDQWIAEWTAQYSLNDLVEMLNHAGVPAGLVMNAEDIAHDPQYLARGMIQYVSSANLGEVGMPGVVPTLKHHPGAIRTIGGEIGQHTNEVLQELLNLSSEQIEQLREHAVVS